MRNFNLRETLGHKWFVLCLLAFRCLIHIKMSLIERRKANEVHAREYVQAQALFL